MVAGALFWLGAALLPPLVAAPLAALIAGASRAAFAAALAGLTLAAFAAGAAFTHFAVDLPRLAPSWRLAAAPLSIAGVVAATAFLVRDPQADVRRLAERLDRLARAVGMGAAWLVWAMALVQFTIVVLRYVFGVNFIMMQESVTYLHGALFLMTAGYALATGDHVRVDLFYRDASPRRKAMIDLAGAYLFLFPFCLLVLWTAAPYVSAAWAAREGSNEQSGIQGVFLLKTLIPLFALVLIAAGFALASRAVDTLRSEKAA
ncbi:MAG: TRAP transporter small permease subunit [Pseudomonadota bacterium]